MDIAEIGFRVDTSGLEAADTGLNKMKMASAGTSAAINRLSAATEAMSASLMQSARTMATVENLKARATLATIKARKDATTEEIRAAETLVRYTQRVSDATAKEMKRATELKKVAAAQREASAAAKAAAGQVSAVTERPTNRVSGAINQGRVAIPRDQMPNRFNTANIAAQFQDVGVTAAMGMNPMTIALQQGTQLSAIINSMENPLKGIGQAFSQIVNKTALLSIGFVGIVAVLIQFVNWVKVGQFLLNGLADVIEATLPYIAGLAAAITLLYSRSILSGLASLSMSILTLGKTALLAGLEMAKAWLLAMGPIGWVIAGIVVVSAAVLAFRDDLKDLLGFDVLEAVKTGINKVLGFFLGMFEGIWAMAQELIRKLKGESEQSIGEAFGTAMKNAMSRDYLGDAGAVVERTAGAIAKSLRSTAKGLGEESDKKGGKTEAERYEDVIKGAERKIATLKAERDAIGMTEEATSRLKYETELLNDAQQKNINLTPEQKARLGELAATMASIEEQTRKTRSAYDFLKDTTRGFIDDMKQGLSEGKSLWESFGTAVLNVINKILDKMLTAGLESLFQGSFGPGGTAGSTGSSILSTIGSLLFSAQGNVFNGGVKPFAKGGSFTNSIVGSPTMFAFANGGKFGVMGEAGPEAVMPLHRGPDGSLGVRTSGAANDNNVIININNFSDAKTSVNQRRTDNGLEIDVVIDDMMGQKLSEEGTASNKALQAFNNRQLISR